MCLLILTPFLRRKMNTIKRREAKLLVFLKNIKPCCSSAAEPAFSCSLVGLKNEYIPSFTISFKSDNIFKEQNSCRGCRRWGG